MTLSPISISNISLRLGALAGAVLTSSVLLFAAPQAHAATNSAYYQVELAQPTDQQKQIIRGVFVKCEGTSCRAPIASSASKNVCISIAREFGEVASFKAGDRVFDANEIEACNEKTNESIVRN